MALIWGSGFVFMKSSLDAYSPIQIISIRMLIGSVVLALFSIKRILKIRLKDILAGGFIGVTLFLGFFFQTMGLKYIPVGNSAFLTATYVVLVPLMVLIFTRRKPKRYNVISAIVMLFGIFFLTYEQQGQLISIGNFYTILCAIFFGLQVILIDHYTKQRDPIVLAIMQMFIAALIGFIVLLFTGGYPIMISIETVPTVLYLGIVASSITYLIQNVAQKYTSPTHAGILMSLESVFGAILGVLLLHEIITVRTFIGCSIIFIALIITEAKFDFRRKRYKMEDMKDNV